MKRPGGVCEIVQALSADMYKIGQDFKDNKVVSKKFGLEVDNVIKKVYEDVFDVPFEARTAVNYTKGTLKTFSRKLDRVRSAIEKDQLNSKFGSLFYAPSSLIKSNPQLGNLMDKLHNVNLGYQGRQSRHNRMFKNIIDHMKKQMLVDGYNKSGMFPNKSVDWRLKKATKNADKFEREIEELSVKAYNNEEGAKDLLIDALRRENDFYVAGEGKVFTDMLHNIETVIPKLETQALDKWRNKYAELEKNKRIPYKDLMREKNKALNIILADGIKSEPMRNAVAEYIDLMDNMYKVLGDGVGAYVKSLKESMRNKYSTEKIDEIAKKIQEKLMPDQIKGYYPHYKRVLSVDFLDNLMPVMQRVSDKVAESLTKDTVGVDKAIDELDSYVSGRIKSRAPMKLGEKMDSQTEYSRNFFTTVKRYVDEIDRFNMVAHADQYTRESLNAAKTLFKDGKPVDGYARATVEMMKDMNARMKGGYGFENENVEMAMKSLLALEFTSKLGWNVRSGVKNATQGLLNLVEFSPLEISKSRKFYEQNEDIDLYVKDMMNEAGFLFAAETGAAPELIQGQFTGKSFTQKVKITDGETIEFKKPGWFSPMYGLSNKVAGKSGWIMSKVENFNRKTSFKIAFQKMYQELDSSTHFKDTLRNQGLKDAQIIQKIKTMSRNYALRKVSLLHFDYTDLGKASWLTHPAGKLLGQFQHYSSKFWEYNYNLAREAGDDIMVGDLTGARAKKAYSMGLIYLAAPVIASAFTGLDFTNIVEHDMMEKFKKLGALFTGDDEDIKKAFYGKGVLTGLPFIGAPLISDMLAVGNVLNFMDMDNETMEKLLIGYEDYALKSGDKKVYELMRILNIQLARGVYKTLPSLMSTPGAALQYEVGLYKTAASKKLKKDAEALVPTEIMQALAMLQAHRQAATSRKGFEPIEEGQVQDSQSALIGESALKKS